jgi:UDP-glucose 4-epimerase
MWLVTGASGYLGQAVTANLDQSNIPFFGMDRIESPNGSLQVAKLDLKDIKAVRGAIRSKKITGLIHLAALKDVNESMLNPEKYRFENVELFSNLLENLRVTGLEKIIYASSAAVYGSQSGIIDEDSLTSPISVYGETKLTCESIVQNFAKSQGIQSISLRIFNMASSTPSLKVPNLSTGVMQHIYKAQVTRSIFKIYGDKLMTSDGSTVRDYISVNDVSKIVSFLALQKEELNFDVLNVGTGTGTSLKSLLRIFEIERGVKVNSEVFEKNSFDIDVSIANIQRLRSLVHGVKFESIDEIVRSELRARANLILDGP